MGLTCETGLGLGDRERTLAALCDAFVPGGDGLPSASVLGVPARLRGELRAIGRPGLVDELDRLLDTVESPLLNLVLGGHPVRFSNLTPIEREAYLRGWAKSALPLKRKAFQVLKRLTLLYAYGADASPYGRLAGYEPAPQEPAPLPPPLRVRQPRPGEIITADACVIGSGAGGSVVAATLAAAGQQVVLLERGHLHTEQDFDGRELTGFATLFLDHGIASTEDRAIALLAGSTVGGGTVVNWSTSLRLPEAVRDEWERHGIEDLSDHFAAVEERLDIDTEESGRNGPNARLEAGLRELQLPSRTIPRNVRGCGDCGPCGFGCRRAAKQSTLRTYLMDACGRGAEILAGCEARRLDVDRGQVRGVTARVGGGEVTVRAPLVALAGGALCSPPVLLRSGIDAPQAGRNLHLHPTTAIFGVYDEPTPAWRGVPQAVVSEAFADLVAGYGFRLECPPALPGILASSLPWWGSAEHRAQMVEAARTAPFIAIVRDREGGRVELDRSGEARLRYRVGPLERQHLVRAMIEGARVHLAAGARRVGTLHTPPLTFEREEAFDRFAEAVERRGTAPNRVLLFSAHQMSTCRIGTSPGQSVARPDGQVWGVRGLYVTDASAFPTASGVNPMLTTMALARRTAAGMLR